MTNAQKTAWLAMKARYAPAITLGLLSLCFLGYLVVSASQLPARVATHFNASGHPNGWMSRSSHLLVMAIFGFAFPLFLVGIFFVLRFVPDSSINIPRRDYWLAPERRDETFAYLFRHSLWFACMALGFVIGLHFLVVQANGQLPVRLSTPMILGLGGSFLMGATIWVVSILRHFSQTA